MKAIVQNNYGSPDTLRVQDVENPVIQQGEVLVRVRASALNAGDAFTMRGSPWLVRFMIGFPKPKNHVLGWDMAGQVEALGKGVTGFRPGDEVFATCSRTLAEYVSVAEGSLAMKPVNLTAEQAAAVPTAAITALQELRDAGKLRQGQRVLINGAAGGVGTFAVQIAKAFGAEVTGVCSTGNLELVRSLGADHVVDYTREDFTRNGQRYDLILDNVANRSFTDLRRALAPDGKVLPNSGHGGMSYVFKAFLLSLFTRQVGSMSVAKPNSKDMVFLIKLIEAGMVTPVIDRTYPFQQAAEALSYVGTGHCRGKVVITMDRRFDETPSILQTVRAGNRV